MIQITLNANQFEYAGTHKGREYDSLQINYTSNGRVYFTAIKNNMRMFEVIKQMKLDNGQVIISFGKNDKIVIGTYIDTEAVQETPVNEVTEQTEETVNDHDETKEEVKKESEPFTVNKTKEVIPVRGFMGKVEEIEVQRIEHDELELYLYKSKKFYAVYEKNTGKQVTSISKTRKEAIDKLKEFLFNYYDKLKYAITETLEKDGHISNHELGSWIR